MDSHLLYIVVQSYDGQWCRQAGVGRYGRSYWWRLTDASMVTGLKEVGCLVVFIQNVNLEVGKSWQGVAIVLLSLKGKWENPPLLTGQSHFSSNHFNILGLKKQGKKRRSYETEENICWVIY